MRDTPIKYYNESIRKSYKDIEHTANEKLIAMLPEEFRQDYRELIEVDTSSAEHEIIKAADKLSAYIKTVEELNAGNREFAMAEKALRAEVEKYRRLPEVDWFCNTYLNSFSLTLDELGE